MLITSVTKQRDYNNMVGTKMEIKRSTKSGDILLENCICTIEYIFAK